MSSTTAIKGKVWTLKYKDSNSDTNDYFSNTLPLEIHFFFEEEEFDSCYQHYDVRRYFILFIPTFFSIYF